MQKKKKKTRLFIFLIICFVLVPFLLTKGCNYMESLNQAENSLSEPISSISEQIEPSACVYTHAHTPARTHSHPHYAGAYAHERAHTRVHNAHVYAQAHSISRANWTGTAVPNSGTLTGGLYINTELSNNEVESMIDEVVIEMGGGQFMYPVLICSNNEGFDIMLLLTRVNSSYSIVFNYGEYGNTIYDSEEGGFNMGNIEVSGYLNNNSLNSLNLTYSNEFNGIPVGTENNQLKSLISTTPFEQSSNNELSIGNLFAQLGNAIIIFGGAVVNVFISMEPIFWNEGPTLIFILLIASVSFALVFWGIELLISLIGVFKTKRKKKK